MSSKMAIIRGFAVMLILGFASAAPQLKKRACPAITPNANPSMASGYTAKVVMNGLKNPREIVFDPLGNLLALEQGGGGVRYIKLTDNGGTDVCSASSKTLINDRTVRIYLIPLFLTALRNDRE